MSKKVKGPQKKVKGPQKKAGNTMDITGYIETLRQANESLSAFVDRPNPIDEFKRIRERLQKIRGPAMWQGRVRRPTEGGPGSLLADGCEDKGQFSQELKHGHSTGIPGFWFPETAPPSFGNLYPHPVEGNKTWNGFSPVHPRAPWVEFSWICIDSPTTKPTTLTGSFSRSVPLPGDEHYWFRVKSIAFSDLTTTCVRKMMKTALRLSCRHTLKVAPVYPWTDPPTGPNVFGPHIRRNFMWEVLVGPDLFVNVLGSEFGELESLVLVKGPGEVHVVESLEYELSVTDGHWALFPDPGRQSNSNRGLFGHFDPLCWKLYARSDS